jgi:hypothetical protein
MECSNAVRSLETEKDRPLNDLAEILARACNARAALSLSAADLRQDMDILIAADAELDAWAASLPPSYAYQTIFTRDDLNEVYGNFYHVYVDSQPVVHLNIYRGARIFLHTVLMRYCQNSPHSVQAVTQYQKSIELVSRLGAELCASVPCQLGMASPGNRAKVQQGWTGMMLLWPLCVYACTSVVPQQCRSWIWSRFEYLANEVGIRECLLVVDILKAIPIAFGPAPVTRENVKRYESEHSSTEDGI